MTDFAAANYARTLELPPRPIDGGDYGGRERHLYDHYLTSGGEQPGDRLLIGRLDPGERLLDGWLLFGALGEGATLRLGDEEDDDRLLPATAAASAGLVRMTSAAALGHRQQGSTRVPLLVTFGGASPAPGQPIRLRLALGSD